MSTHYEMKNDCKSAFIDTALFIYLLEEQGDFTDLSEFFLRVCYARNVRLVTSILTYLEFSVKPYREERHDLIDDYNSLLSEANFFVTTVTLPDCDQAARLRAKYSSLKAFDALQIACALKEGCDVFACNDKRLKRVEEIDILILDDVKNLEIDRQEDTEQEPEQE